MIIKQYKPSGILSQFIRYYWSIEAEANEPLHTERVLPLGNVDLMFHYKNSFVVQKVGMQIGSLTWDPKEVKKVEKYCLKGFRKTLSIAKNPILQGI